MAQNNQSHNQSPNQSTGKRGFGSMDEENQSETSKRSGRTSQTGSKTGSGATIDTDENMQDQ